MKRKHKGLPIYILDLCYLVCRAKYREIFSPYCSYLTFPRVLWFYSHSRCNNKLTSIMELHPSRFLLHPQLISTCRRADAKSSGSLQRFQCCREVNRNQCWIALLQLPAEWRDDRVAANLWVQRASLRSQFQTSAGVFATRLQGSMPADVKQSHHCNRTRGGSHMGSVPEITQSLSKTQRYTAATGTRPTKNHAVKRIWHETNLGSKVKFMFLAVLGLWPTAFHLKLMERLGSSDPSIY